MIALLVGMGGVQSCNKQGAAIPTYPIASLNVVHALPTANPLILVEGTTGPVKYAVPGIQNSYVQGFGAAMPLPYASIAVLSPKAGSDTFYAVQANADTGTVGTATPKLMYNGVLDMKAGGLYSLFIAGVDTTQPDYLFVQDKLLSFSPSDSSCGVRFVNLSAGSGAISINISGKTNGSEVSSLAFKGITEFKSYAATSAIGDYLFEFRDATTGTMLAAFDLTGVNNNGISQGNTVRSKNVTIALIGQPGALQCLAINSF
jgi:hypothetical protein